MKKIFKSFRRWRYRRLYSRLFRIYMNKFDYAFDAKAQTDAAFGILTGLFGEEFENWYHSSFRG